MINLKVIKRDLAESNEYLRSQGLIPAVLYSAELPSTPVSVNDIEFRKVYREAGTSHIINTTGDFDEMCVVQDMQVHVVSGELMHLDFKAVAKGQTTEIAVSVQLTGESPADKNSIGLVNFANEEVVVETIPSRIPDHFEVDISGLEAIGNSIKAGDIKLPEGVVLVDNADMTLVSIVSIKENVEEELSEEPVVMEPEMVNQKGKGEAEAAE
jgi:large subunit ribosomal protein L25